MCKELWEGRAGHRTHWLTTQGAEKWPGTRKKDSSFFWRLRNTQTAGSVGVGEGVEHCTIHICGHVSILATAKMMIIVNAVLNGARALARSGRGYSTKSHNPAPHWAILGRGSSTVPRPSSSLGDSKQMFYHRATAPRPRQSIHFLSSPSSIQSFQYSLICPEVT